MSRTKHAAVRGQRLKNRLVDGLAKVGFRDEYFLILMAIFIGGATGLFAHMFYFLIEWAGAYAYGHGTGGGLYGGRPWMLVLLPAAGALAVGIITYFFASEAKGHGVPEVMDAMYRQGGVIRPRVAAAKAISSALTIGSGGSAGTEGPIVQIGAVVGSSVGQYLGIPRRQMSVVVACGVSAGIAAIFNAPIAGVLFALEIFLKDFSFRTFSPVVFSSVISCSIVHALRAEDVAIFEVKALREAGYLFAGAQLPLFLVLGVVCALGAVLFTRALYLTEDFVEKWPVHDVLKPVFGAVGLGLCGLVYYWLSSSRSVPVFFGNGYPAIDGMLSSTVLTHSAYALLGIFALKIVATCCTLGSGGSGGVFAPSLLMGASLGAAFGMVLRDVGWINEASVNAYALVGMAAVVAGTTHAPLTAIVMVYEITREPKTVLPVMFAAIVATAGAQLMLRGSIYTLKLRRRGVRVGAITDLTILRRISVGDVKSTVVQFVHPADPMQRLLDLAGETEATDFVVVDEQGVYQGMVTGADVRTALLQREAVSLLIVGELMRAGVPTVSPGETLDMVLDRFSQNDIESLPLARAGDSTHIDGIITRQAVMRRYQEELDRQST